MLSFLYLRFFWLRVGALAFPMEFVSLCFQGTTLVSTGTAETRGLEPRDLLDEFSYPESNPESNAVRNPF